MNKYLKFSEIRQFREKLLKKQNGICPLCKKQIIRPSLDHEHRKKLGGSGFIRGVLCSDCNAYLGKIENNAKRYSVKLYEIPMFLENVAIYLREEHVQILHPSEKPKKRKLKKSSYNKLKKANDGKYKLPKYNGNMTKRISILFNKYNIEPEFYGQKYK